jgi:hypothetical protein
MKCTKEEEMEKLKKSVELLQEELKKSNIIANKNLPSLAKAFFVFLFFIIMSFLKPELVIKIVEVFINSFGAVKAVGIE